MSNCLDAGNQQQIIQCILNQAWPALNQPGNTFFLPQYVVNNKLDPYYAPSGSTWPINDLVNANILSAATAVCSAIQINNMKICGSVPFYIGEPSTGVDILLSNVEVTGASNIAVTGANAVSGDGFTIQMTFVMSTLGAPWPAVISVTGSFSLTLQCCCSQDNATCAAAPQPQTGSGTFVATIARSNGMVTFQITDLAHDTLDIEVTSVQYNANTSDITVTPTITSVPGGAGSYNNLVNEAFSNPTTLEFIVQQVNDQLNSQSSLDIFSNNIQTELDNYLQSTGTYPYNNSSSAVF